MKQTTLEDLYQICNILHIHGSVGEDSDMPPFMGHCNQDGIDEHSQQYDEAYEIMDEGEASIQNAIVEYLTAIYKDTSEYDIIQLDK